ncbi:MAG: hypothetical protein ABR915_03500 [Thermoguttaceae bacterium]
MEAMRALGPILFLAGLAAAFFVVWRCLSWVIGPLDRAARNRRFPLQFSLADFLCLFVLVQLPLAAINWMARGGGPDQGPEAVVLVVVAAVAGLIWWMGVQTLSRAGIHGVWQRCVVLTVAVPVAFVAGPATCILTPRGLYLLFGEQDLAGCWMLLAVLLVACAVYGLGRLTRAIVAAAEAQRSEPPTPTE